MAGFNATTASTLDFAVGMQSLITQSALGFVPGHTVGFIYAQDSTLYMQGAVITYNAITGAMTVDISYVQGGPSVVVPAWNTQPWGSIQLVSLSGWILSLVGGISERATTISPTIWVRTLDQQGDPQRGAGTTNFVSDIEAVSQIIAQRLKLLQGEWFEDKNAGTPLFQRMLGVPQTTEGVALLLRQRILGCPYVTGINSFVCGFYSGRAYTFTAHIQTMFGEVTVTNI